MGIFAHKKTSTITGMGIFAQKKNNYNHRHGHIAQ